MALYEKIYQLVKEIPYGQVTSYGAIARVLRCSPRQVGYAMAATPKNQAIPWHRVVNSQGKISARKDGDIDSKQQQLLIAEGVIFDNKQSIDLQKFSWDLLDMEFCAENL